MLPSKIINCSLFNFLKIDEEIIAAWLLPSPGRREQIGEIKIVAKVGFINLDFLIGYFFVICFGGIDFVLIDWIIVEVPKSPVRSGSKGFGKFKLKVDIPKNPARKNIKIEVILFFEFKIRNITTHIKINPIILWMVW